MTASVDTFLDIVNEMIRLPKRDFVKYQATNGCKLRGKVENSTLFLYYIFVPEEKRNTGLLKSFFQQLHMLPVRRVAILGVQSDVLDAYLQRFQCNATGEKFTCMGTDYLIEFDRYLL